MTPKPFRQDSYVSNQIRDNDDNIDEVVRNQENMIKKYYKEYLLSQVI